MNTIGINELRGELVHTLFAIEDVDVLKRISRYVSRQVKTCAPAEEDEVEYIEKEELLDSIRQGLTEVREARRTGRCLMSATELLNEL
ncbi:MAG: hypothetical protein NC388_07375 [Clostridium sp.]|nr:hypothetical protein [Clostridium sp.]